MQAFSREDYEEVEAYLESLVEMGRDRSYDRHISFDPRIIGGDALINLGVCLVRLARRSGFRCQLLEFHSMFDVHLFFRLFHLAFVISSHDS